MDAQNTVLVPTLPVRASTSTHMRRLERSERCSCIHSVFLRIDLNEDLLPQVFVNVDLNADIAPRMLRIPFSYTFSCPAPRMLSTLFWCIFCVWERRRQRGSSISLSTSTKIRHFGYPEHRSRANFALANVDLNTHAAPRTLRTLFWCSFGFLTNRR